MIEILRKNVGNGIDNNVTIFEQYLKTVPHISSFHIEKHHANFIISQFNYGNFISVQFREGSTTFKWSINWKEVLMITMYLDGPTLIKNSIKDKIPDPKNLDWDMIEFIINLNKIENFA